MIKIKLIGYLITIAALLMPTYTLAQTASIELGLGETHLFVKADARIFLSDAYLYFGASFLDNDHDYEFYDLNISLRDHLISPAIILGIGIKEIIADVDIVTGNDYDIISSPVFVAGSLDFRRLPINIPVSLTVDGAFAPAALCHQNCREYGDVRAAIQFHINYHLALVARYEYIEMNLKKNFIKSTFEDEIGLIGIKLYF